MATSTSAHSESHVQVLERRQLLTSLSATLLPRPQPTDTTAVLADLNGDRIADQVAVDHGRTPAAGVVVRLALGKGDGTFRAVDRVHVADNTARALAVGDVDGDGAADVSIAGDNPRSLAPITSTHVLTLRGDGKGRLLRATDGTPLRRSVFVSEIAVAQGLAVADLDASGANDIALLGISRQAVSARGVSSIAVVWGTGPGPSPAVVIPPTMINTPPLTQVNALYAGDLDGDGRADLVAAHDRPLPPSPLAVIRPDLVTVRFPTARTPVVKGGVNPLYLNVTPAPGSADTDALSILPMPTARETLGVADLDRDGRADLVGRRGNTILHSSFDKATLWFTMPRAAESKNTPSTTLGRMRLGDIDGDGLPDVLATTAALGHAIGRNLGPTPKGTVQIEWSRVPLPTLLPEPMPRLDGQYRVADTVLALG